MNKAYLLIICLLVSSFTGCTEDVKDDSPVEEILYEGDEAGECSDEADNDKDGLFDCDDDQCAGSPACKAEDKPKDEKNNTEETELVKGWNEGDFAYNINFTDKEGGHFELYGISTDFVLLTFSASWDTNGKALFGWKEDSASWQKNAANNLTDIVIVMQDNNGENPSHDHLRDLHAQFPNSGIMTKDASLMNGTTAWEMNNFTGFPSMILMKKNDEGNLVINSTLEPIEKVLVKIGGSEYSALGCMDSNATNYDSEAEVDDNSCEYPEPFQPERRSELIVAVDEWIEDSDHAKSNYGHISTWDTSLITDMSGLFYDNSYPYDYYDNFNSDISNWDVSSVTDMSSLFSGAISFDGDISDWNVSSVTNMEWMFGNAHSFNQDLSDWDVSSGPNMEAMFWTALSFNGDISGWDVSNVTNMDSMFYRAESFNGDISGWDVSSVTDISAMFDRSLSFNGNISGWDVSNVTDMRYMFRDAESFNQDIGSWDVSSVTKINSMFNRAYSFNQDISGWDVSSVINMNYMFHKAYSFNQNISAWDVSNVTDMSYMFTYAHSFNGNISGWDVSNVTNMDSMFYEAVSFNGEIGDWDVSSVTDMTHMFAHAESLNQDVSDWDVSSVTKMLDMFYGTDLSDGNKCAIHTEFSSNDNWGYDWDEYCSDD